MTMSATVSRPARVAGLLAGATLAALTLAGCAGHTMGHHGQPGQGLYGSAPAPMPARVSSVVTLTASLSGAQEVPPNTRPGTGMADIRFDKDTRVLTYRVTHSGLSGPLTGAHIHGPAAPGANAGVVVPFSPAADGSISGTATLNPTQAGDLLAGLYYVNLHTAAHPGGEIRGQLRLQP